MSIQRLRPTAYVNISYGGKSVEVELADGDMYSKEPLADCSEFHLDKFEPEDSYYSTDPVAFAAEVKEFTTTFIRRQTIEFDTDRPDYNKTVILD